MFERKHVAYAVLILLLLYVLCKNEIDGFMNRRSTCNAIDGRCYDVVKKYAVDTHEPASESLARLNKFTLSLLKHLRQEYLWKENANPYRRRMVKFLIKNYNPDNLIENAPNSDVNTSYVEDKGKVFAVCLREKDSGNENLHQDDILQFVMMHELAHLSTPVIGHEDIEFWTNFKILIDIASKLKLHHPIDFANTPFVYCSLRITYSPYYDDRIPLP